MKAFMIATFTDLILRVVLAKVRAGTALGATGIWISWPIGWTIAMVMSVIFYKRIHWEDSHDKDLDAVYEADPADDPMH